MDGLDTRTIDFVDDRTVYKPSVWVMAVKSVVFAGRFFAGNALNIKH